MTTDNVIQLKSSTTSTNTPSNGSALTGGEIAIHRADHQLFYLNTSGSPLTG